MQSMFRDASSFSSDVSLWDTSSVERMDQMFQGTSSFSSDVSLWDTSSVQRMTSTLTSGDRYYVGAGVGEPDKTDRACVSSRVMSRIRHP